MRESVTNDLVEWDNIKDHRTGSPGDTKTARWLASRIQDAGAQAALQAFAFTRRVPGDCFVCDGQFRAPGLPLFDGGTTGDGAITGECGPLGSGAAVGVTGFAPFPGHPDSQALLRARQKAEHQAIVAYANAETVAPGLAVLNAPRYNNPHHLPVLQVSSEYGSVLENAATHQKPLRIQVAFTESRETVYNVEVRLAGRRPDLRPLVVMTPRSAWWTCTSERGGGITIWLQAIRHFAANQPDRDIIFTANTGHELGHLGLEHFIAQNPALIAQAHAWVHLGANFAAAGGAPRLQVSDETLLQMCTSAFREQQVDVPDLTPPGTRPRGEAYNVFDGGGRYVSLLGGNPLFHHPEDRWPEAIDLPKTVALSRSMLTVITTLSRV
ncbi:MAG: M28 family peptidase [bacterium]